MPVGYWHLGPAFVSGTAFEPYASVYSNAWQRIVNAVNLASKYNLGVLIDLVTPVGTQSSLLPALLDPNTTFFNGTDSMKKTIAALGFLTDQLTQVTNIVGIQMLDNPDPSADLETFCK